MKQTPDVFNQIANIVRPENEMPEHLTLLVTGTGKRDSETTNTDLLLRTCDNAIYLPETAPATLAHTIVDRYNAYQQQAKDIELLREALQKLTSEVKLGKLNIRKDFELINAHANGLKALKQTEPAK